MSTTTDNIRAPLMKSLRIERFRGFSKLDIPRMTRFTLFGGSNSAGKSSILEAIFLFHARQSPNSFLSLNSFRGLSEVALDPQSLWGTCFYDFNRSNPIVIQPKFDNGYEPVLSFTYHDNYEPKALGMQNPFAPQVVRTDQSILPTTALGVVLKSGNKEHDRLKYLINSFGLTLEVEARGDRPRPVYFIASRVGSNAREDSALFGQLDTTMKSDAVVEFLSIIEPRLKGLTTIANQGGLSVVHGDIGLSRKVPLYQLGDGLVKLASIIVAIASMEGGIVIIDEIGSGIHWSVLGKVAMAIVDAAKRFNAQVIATTHSYEFLRAAHQSLMQGDKNDFVYHRLERDGRNVEVKEYGIDTLGAAIEMGWEVR